LLRGGIVILSLFALAFASCGDSGSDPTVPTDPTDPTNPTQPAVPTVVSIGVRGVSVNDSYQGQRPDIEGLFFQVTWSDGKAEFVEGKDAYEKGFYTVPGYVDRYGDGIGLSTNVDSNGRYVNESTSPGYFRLAHSNGGVYSNEFPLYGAIPLAYVIPGDAGGSEWYSDRPPDWSKIEIIGVYAWKNDNTDTGGNRSARYTAALAAEDPNNETIFVNRKQMKLIASDTYPEITTWPGTATGKTITVTYGRASSSQTTPNLKTTKFTLGNFYWVTLIEAKAIDAETLYFLEDDLTYKNIGSQSPEVKPVSQKMINLMTTAKPRFTVYYTDGKSRDIEWDEFRANVLYRNPEAAADPNQFFVMRSQNTRPRRGKATTIAWNNEETLDYDQDDYTWTFTMNYVPKAWGTGAYTGWVDIPVPVFELTALNAATKVYPSSQVYARFQRSVSPIDEPWPANEASATGEVNDIYKQVKDMWKITGVYERSGVRKTETIKWNPSMLNYGRASQLLTNNGVGLELNDGRVGGGGRGVASNWLEANGPFVTSGNGIQIRDYYLPIYYRGERLQDETETVTVILFIEGGRSY